MLKSHADSTALRLANVLQNVRQNIKITGIKVVSVCYITISLGFGTRICRMELPGSVGLKGAKPP